jgi:hypothetical protein
MGNCANTQPPHQSIKMMVTVGASVTSRGSLIPVPLKGVHRYHNLRTDRSYGGGINFLIKFLFSMWSMVSVDLADSGRKYTSKGHSKGDNWRWSTVIFLFLAALCPWCVQGGWVDPDTDLRHHHTKSHFDGRPYTLVMSDEFNVDGRNFADGSDPRWTAMEKNDYTNLALHYYKEDHVKTNDGYLNISTTTEKFTFSANGAQKTKYYKSGMIQGWNKFCFTGRLILSRSLLCVKRCDKRWNR